MLTYFLLLSCCLLLILSGYNSQHLELASLLLLLVSFAAYFYAAFVMTSTDYVRKLKRTQKIFVAFKRAVILSKASNANIPHRKGGAKQVPIFWIILCCFCMVSVPVTIALAKYYSRYPTFELLNVQVISGDWDNGYWMEYQSESVGHLKFFTRMCKDYKPPFDAGDYLEYLKYEDRMGCWSIRPAYTGVGIRRYGNKTDSELKKEKLQ